MATGNLISVNSLTPTLITPSGIHSGVDLTIYNQGSSGQIIYIGGANVSSANYGVKLSTGEGFGLSVPPRDEVYVIAAADTVSVSVLTLGLP